MNINIRNTPNPSLKGPEEMARVGVERDGSATLQRSSSTTAAQDGVTLTSTAARLRSLENTISSLPVVDSRRVAEIKQTIDEGSYEINPQRIAEKMLDMEQEWSR
ncbi:MAG TPA: flagellar biosynthesis anti-sigma factor FlgM [Gammaproteobacteria bacterium]|nr:flagellar biosynthesis anti-sigma factor FlgM [Gammaproteobacteria bacterium]